MGHDRRSAQLGTRDQAAGEGLIMTAELARHLVRPLLARHPLPWRCELDWTVEVTDAVNAIVIKLPRQVEAEELIEFAIEVAAYDAEGKAQADALLRAHGIDE